MNMITVRLIANGQAILINTIASTEHPTSIPFKIPNVKSNTIFILEIEPFRQEGAYSEAMDSKD